MFVQQFYQEFLQKCKMYHFYIREKNGHKHVVYIDDSLLINDGHSKCTVNIMDTVDVLDRLGLLIRQVKSSKKF